MFLGETQPVVETSNEAGFVELSDAPMPEDNSKDPPDSTTASSGSVDDTAESSNVGVDPAQTSEDLNKKTFPGFTRGGRGHRYGHVYKLSLSKSMSTNAGRRPMEPMNFGNAFKAGKSDSAPASVSTCVSNKSITPGMSCILMFSF